jgi:TonB-dependent SusC/RagA subfamily outer membrane receptor
MGKRIFLLLGTSFFFMLYSGIKATASPGRPSDYYQQNFKGRVVSADEQPFSNLSVRNTTTGVSVTTDRDGYFSIAATFGDTLEVARNGFKKIIFPITEDGELRFVMEYTQPEVMEIIGKPKPVERIYTTVPRHLSTASTDAIYSNDILRSPVTSVRNALTGRMTGIYSLQSSGQPGADGVSVSLRGFDPVVMIDGVVAPLTIFNLEDIESVTLVKDAIGAAMLGVRSSNGVLLITTRKGSAARQQISFTAQTSIQKPIGETKTLRAYDYARLYNEALANDGLPALYTQADLDAYQVVQIHTGILMLTGVKQCSKVLQDLTGIV